MAPIMPERESRYRQQKISMNITKQTFSKVSINILRFVEADESKGNETLKSSRKHEIK